MTSLSKPSNLVTPVKPTKPPGNMEQAISGMVAVAKQVRPEHITKVLEIANRVTEGQLAIAALDVATVQRLRLLRARYDNDLHRAEAAAELLRELRHIMTPEQQSEMAVLIIKITLGLDPTA